MKFDQESKEAAGKGDLTLASKLLDDAIKYLNALPENAKPVERIVELPLTQKGLRLQRSSKYEQGKEVRGYQSAFERKING